MGSKFQKPGKVAIIVRGRYAGRKVVILQTIDNGSKVHPFGHALVAGVERYPSKVTKSMGQKKIAKKSKVKPFIKVINYNHLMPTRYSFDLDDLKNTVTAETFSEPTHREEAKKLIKKSFETKYQAGKNKWFFTKLRF